MQVSELLARLRIELNDPKGKRWSDAYLLAVVNDFYCLLANRNPATEIVTHELTAGSAQTVSGCCETIHSLVGATASGQRIETRKENHKARVAYGRAAALCSFSSDGKRNVLVYWLDERNPSRFFVDPPIKEGEKVTVELECSARPGNLSLDGSLDDHRCSLIPGLIHYVKSIALGIENESPIGRNAAIGERNMALQDVMTSAKR